MTAIVNVCFDQQIFRRQPRGGISRYFIDLRQALEQESMVRISRRADAHVVHATFYGGQPYKLKQDQSLISSLYDLIPERHPEHFFLSQWRSPHGNKKNWLEMSDQILSISQASADDLSFFYPSIQRPIHVIHLATGMQSVKPQAIPSLLQRRFWLMVGKRHAYKNGMTILLALKKISSIKEIPLLVCAGGGRWRKREERLIQDNGLQKHILQLSADHQQLAWLYRHAEAVLVPSICEGFSLPLIEALVCNTPVLASDIEAHREVGGGFATLLPASNALAWSEALAAIASNIIMPPKSALGDAGFQQLCDYYSLERMAQEHVVAYRANCLSR